MVVVADVKIGMAVMSAFGDQGFSLYRDWSTRDALPLARMLLSSNLMLFIAR